jgi:hypothetical protein
MLSAALASTINEGIYNEAEGDDQPHKGGEPPPPNQEPPLWGPTSAVERQRDAVLRV